MTAPTQADRDALIAEASNPTKLIAEMRAALTAAGKACQTDMRGFDPARMKSPDHADKLEAFGHIEEAERLFDILAYALEQAEQAMVARIVAAFRKSGDTLDCHYAEMIERDFGA